MLRFNDIADSMLEYNPGVDLELLQRAYVFSAKVHEGQERLSGEPYLIHPLEVAGILVDLELLKTVTGAMNVELAEEHEFKDTFPGCELGAMPPFGNLYGMRTLVANSLAEDESIAFNAGTHKELMRMTFADFARVVQPEIVEFTAHV